MSGPIGAPVQAAVIGLGFIGLAHVEALRRLGIPIAGVLGHGEDSTRRSAAALGLRPYTGLDELLADPEVSVVHSCGPNAVHAEQNLRSLVAGRHVFSEKPLGTSVQECERQLQVAGQLGRQHGVNFSYRGYAAVQAMREVVRSGELGEVKYLRGHYLQDWLLLPGDYNWRVTAAAPETRAVADIGSHLADLARFVTGLAPERLYAQFSTLHPERLRPEGAALSFGQSSGPGVPVAVCTEDQASLLAHYPGGVRASFEVSQVAAGHKNDLQLEVLGTHGSVTWRQERPEELLLGSREARRVVRLKDTAHPFTHYPGGHPEGYPDAITNVIRAYYSALAGTPAPYPTFEDGLAAAQFTEAAYRSSVSGEWTALATPS